ncbi:MAG TPA: S1C family serine protease, partial [Candidatus Eisenbergiella intestinigallinarum]|nr:S1C family serine protease [Candidatus Eisenbergiella intestinigallinarum]
MTDQDKKNGTEQEIQEKKAAPKAVTASDSAGTDISFIKEKVKERPINKRKLLKRTMITASMAVIFGLIACFTFLVLEPVFSNWLYPEEEPEPVQLQEESENEEMLPEDMVLETESEEETTPPVQTTVVERVELDVSDYQTLYSNLYKMVQEVSKSLVTVIGITSDTDWLNNSYENEGQNAGLIVADNGRELLILTEKEIVDQSEELNVVFCDNTQVRAELKQANSTVGLAVISVDLTDISDTTRETISPARLASSSNSGLLATPVAALGRPLGTANSVVYGMITSADGTLNLADGNYQLLTTDMYGSTYGSGIITNLSGQVLGIICQENSAEDTPNLITAYGISGLKNLIEKLSNGQP